MKYIIFTDGGARGNPGPSGIGFVIQNPKGEKVFEQGKFIGKATNNVAEYMALVEALKKARELGGTELVVNMDSELVVRQMQGSYKIKEPALKKLAQEVFGLAASFQTLKFNHIYRENNKTADLLVNQAIDNNLAPF